MKRRCALVLALVLLTMLSGCRPSDMKKLEGKWTAKVDLASAYEDLLAREDATVAAHIQLKDMKVDLTLRFEEDGTYRLRANAKDLEKAAQVMDPAIRQGMAAYLQAQTGKTMDNLLSATGQTVDELMERYFEADLADAMADSLEAEGTYKVSGGKLILLDKAGNKVFEGKYDVEEDTLKLKSGVTRPLIASLLPVTMEKK